MLELNKLKALLGIEGDAENTSLTFILDDVAETIQNYCNVEAVPEGLTNTAYRMAMDLYRNENVGREECAPGSVSSITEGDTSTSFRQYADDNFKDTVLKNYIPALNRYRRVTFS